MLTACHRDPGQCSDVQCSDVECTDVECTDGRYAVGCGAQRIGDTEPDSPTVAVRQAEAQGGGGHRR